MDYPFFIKAIADVPLEACQRLLAHVADATFERHNYFGKEQNIQSHHKGNEQIPEIAAILDAICPPMDRSKYTGCDVNKIPAGSKIIEHSDVGSVAASVPFNTSHRHKVHVPLVSQRECITFHRRTQEAPFHSYHMEVGKAYLYNDYALHGFWNKGTEIRLHLIMSFEDLDWSWKHSFIETLNLKGTQKYEEDFQIGYGAIRPPKR